MARSRFLLTGFIAIVLIASISIPAAAAVAPDRAGRLDRMIQADPETFRMELDAYFADLEASSAALYSLPAVQSLTARAGLEPMREITSARNAVPLLRRDELEGIRDAFIRHPAILAAPDVVDATLARVMERAPAGRLTELAVDGNTCNPGPGTPMGKTDYYIAKGVALAAQIVMEALPTDFVSIAVREISVAAWGIAEVAALVLEGLQEVEAECLGAQEEVAQGNFRTTVTTFLNNETNYVSDNELDLGVTTITNNDNTNTQTITNNDNTNTQTLLTKMDANTLVITTAIDASATAIINNDNKNTTNIINNDNANTTTIVNNDNTNRDLMVAEMRKIGCDVIRLLNTPEGQRQSSLSSCNGQPAFPYNFPEKSMQVTGAFTSTAIDRDAIDQPVRRPFASTVSLEIHLLEGRLLPTYYLPVARGGMLEEVKALVWTTLDAQRELGIAVGQLAAAESFAKAADVLLNEKSFVDAYRSYAKAYQQLLPQ